MTLKSTQSETYSIFSGCLSQLVNRIVRVWHLSGLRSAITVPNSSSCRDACRPGLVDFPSRFMHWTPAFYALIFRFNPNYLSNVSWSIGLNYTVMSADA